jgi:uncharacterized protein
MTDINGPADGAELNPPADLPGQQPAARLSLDGPVVVEDRIISVDVLRGFALLGILVINIAMFGLPQVAMKNPVLAGGGSGADLTVWTISYVVFFQKFMSIFSMLFGAGLILMYERAEAAGRSFGATYYRRLGWLLVIGILHAYFLWWGDILFSYAVSGLILYPMRRQSGRRLVIIGVILFFIGSLFIIGLGLFFDFARNTSAEADAANAAGESLTSLQESMSEVWPEIEKEFKPTPEKINEEIEAFRGGYWSVFIRAFPQVLALQTIIFVLFIVWRVVGFMLIGMGLMKLGVFTAERSRRFYLICIIAGYGIGLPIVGNTTYKLISSDFDFINIFGISALYDHIGILLITAGHVGLLMLIYQSKILIGFKKRLAAVGRMALSNYLMHSIILAPIFYGYGLGLFGKVDYFGLMGFVIGMWIVQLYLSPLWLGHFRFGPFEWLWRSLTYKKRQPMRIS